MADKDAGHKHEGDFYAAHYRPGEAGDVEDVREQDLGSEAAMLRVSIRRVFALADGVDDVDEAVQILGALGIACTRLASVLRTQKLLHAGGEGDLQAAISQMLAEVLDEMKGKS